MSRRLIHATAARVQVALCAEVVDLLEEGTGIGSQGGGERCKSGEIPWNLLLARRASDGDAWKGAIRVQERTLRRWSDDLD